MYEGGLFLGRQFNSENEDDKKTYQFAICWGTLIADPKVEMFSSQKTSFCLKYYGKNYQNVVLWGETQASHIANSLEKGDNVLVLGTMTRNVTVIKRGEHKGEEREYRDINAQIIVPMTCIEFIIQLFGSSTIQNIIANDEANIEADVIESADDFVEVESLDVFAGSYDGGFDDLEIPDDVIQ